MLAVVNCNLPVSDLNCSHSFYDTDQRPVAISLPFYSQFVNVMFHIHSAGSLISREASTVLVERKIIAAVPNVLVVFYHHNEPVSVCYFMLLHFYCFLLYQLTFTVLKHTLHF